MGASERNTLPGGPSNALVKRVRQSLWLNFQAKPQRNSRAWIDTWAWAASICGREDIFNRTFGIKTYRRAKPWPSPNEIASQYLLICLSEMHKYHAFKLHRRASECLEVDATKEEHQFIKFVTEVFQEI